MATVTAKLSDYRQSPRKVRLVAGLVRGKSVDEALSHLKFLPKRATGPLSKLISSAVANAKSLNVDSSNLIVKEITVNAGKILYRRRPASRGRASVIRKRTSHVMVVLSEAPLKQKKTKNQKKSQKS